METERPSESPPSRWARIDHYLLGLARRRRWIAQSRKIHKSRSQPEDPRLMLSTLPFVVMIIALALIGLAIAIIAIPGQEWAQPVERPEPQAELGKAQPGWLERSREDPR